MTAAPDAPLHFLTVGAAAEHLGISRLKLREGVARKLIPAQRDNEGNLRVDLSALAPRVVADLQSSDFSASDLVDMLFDEIEELQARLAGQDRLIALMDRQADAMDRGGAALDRAASDKARLTALLDRAMAQLDGQTPPAITAVTDRALGLLEDTGAKLETSLHQSARFSALLERALKLSQTGSALAPTTDRAMDMLERALAEAETARATSGKATALLGRAMDMGARLEADLATKTQTIAQQKGVVEQALAMSERAMAAVTPPKRKSFFARLLGI